MNNSPNKLMIVDDEDYMVSIIARMAKRSGLEMCSAADGISAIEVFKKERPSLVFLDINLPELMGDKVFAAIKEVESQVKVFFISGSQEAINNLKEANIPAEGYILKPFQTEDILKIIGQMKPPAKALNPQIMPGD